MINRLFPLWLVLGIAIPAAIGFAIDGTLAGAATGALWGGLVRMFFLHHVTWSINSVCHFFGTRRFEVEDHSTNVFWLAPLSFGESWHHNHHAFPRSATHGLKWYEIDPSAWVILGMKAPASRGTSSRSARSARSRSWPARPPRRAAPPRPRSPRRSGRRSPPRPKRVACRTADRGAA